MNEQVPISEALAGLYAQIRSLKGQNQQLVQLMNQEIGRMKGLIEQVSAGRSQMKTIEDLPGKRVPYWYSDDISVAASTAKVQGSIEISRDGPFVVTAIMAAWLPSSGATGLWRPVSSTVIQSISDMPSSETHILDFKFEIVDHGSDRQWQNSPVPSAYLFCSQDRPAYLSVSGIFEPTSTIGIDITPTVAPSEAGVLNFCFQGYKIITIEGLTVA